MGDADRIDWTNLTDADRLFEEMGFPPLGKAPLMPLDHQIAQKIHAVSDPGDRARDLIDLQLIVMRAEVDLAATRKTCERLFAYRKAQPWPPTIVKQNGWDTLYAELAVDLPVSPNIDDAIRWANGLITEIDESQ